MMTIDTFICNLIEVNTYLVYDDTKKAVVIDPGFGNDKESSVFDEYVNKNGIEVTRCIITHSHPDHLMGGAHIVDKYGVIPETNKLGEKLFRMSEAWAVSMGMDGYRTFPVNYSLSDGYEIMFGNTSLKVIYTPGHAEGSVCFYNEVEKVLFSGDVLFRGGIGRTDLPTGSYETLEKVIKEKIFTMPDDVTVYSGHGSVTRIGYEKRSNPFF